MLATSQSGERSRRWLQARIWGSRERTNSQASLRRELSNLKPLLNGAGRPLLVVEHETVAIDLARVVIDVRDRQRILDSRGEFLEGIDIAWEEGFEDWLREERLAIESAREEASEILSSSAARSANEARSAHGGRATLGIVVHDDEMRPEHAATIDRIADVLAEQLARLRWLPLVGAPATKLAIDGPAGLLRAGKMLGVDYLLHCQFNPDETVTLALAQAGSARMLWSDRRGLGSEDEPCDTGRIATDTIAAISARIETDQLESVRTRPVEQLTANELLWLARWHTDRFSRYDAGIADQLLHRAAQKQPHSADLLIEQARSKAAAIWATGGPSTAIEELRGQVVLARDLDPYDARAWLLLGLFDLWLARHDSASALMHEAIRLEPSMSAAYGYLGGCYTFSGQPSDGIRLLNNSLRLNPDDPSGFYRFGKLSLANLMAGDTGQALLDANAALARRPGFVVAHICKVAALSALDDPLGARAALAAFCRAKPRFATGVIARLPFRDSAWNDRLRRAIEAVKG